jgi:hypothetical protein
MLSFQHQSYNIRQKRCGLAYCANWRLVAASVAASLAAAARTSVSGCDFIV